MRRRFACRSKAWQELRSSRFSFPLCKSGPALGRVRPNALRVVAALRRGQQPVVSPRLAEADRRCAGLYGGAGAGGAALSVLAGRGRPVRTARKNFELRGDSLFYRFCAAVRRRYARRQKSQRAGKRRHLKSSFPLCKSGSAFFRMRSVCCELRRLSGGVRWLYGDVGAGGGAVPACAGGRPDGTARKKLELRGSQLVLPPATRRQGGVRRRFARHPKSQRAGKRRHLKSSFPLCKSGSAFFRMRSVCCELRRLSGGVRGFMAARALVAALSLLAQGGRPDGTARKDFELRGESAGFAACCAAVRHSLWGDVVGKSAVSKIFLPALQERASIF